MARIAAAKMRAWVNNGMYARLFDAHTTIDMLTPWLYFNVEQLKDDPKLEVAISLLIAYTTTRRAQGKTNKRCITVLDECWALLQSESLAPVVVQLFRTARKRNACVWGISQAVEDFTGTPDKPNEFGGAILATTAIKMIGRQKGNLDVLRHFVHLNETTINRVKSLGMTEKGRKSEFLIVIGEKAETTHSLFIVPTALEYWLLTTFPRERWYRQWWLATHSEISLIASFKELAMKFPNGLSEVPELRGVNVRQRSESPGHGGHEERSSQDDARRTSRDLAATEDAMEEELVSKWQPTSGSHCVYSQLRSAFGGSLSRRAPMRQFGGIFSAILGTITGPIGGAALRKNINRIRTEILQNSRAAGPMARGPHRGSPARNHIATIKARAIADG